MQLLLRVLIGMALLGGGVASGAVTVSVVNATDGTSTVNVPAGGGTFNVAVKVTATGEGTGISGVQFDLQATGPGNLTLNSGAYATPDWEADTGVGLTIPTGAVKPGPVGPAGSGVAAGVLANGVTSTVATLTLQADAATGAYSVNVSPTSLAFPDFVGSTADIAITQGTPLTVSVASAVQPQVVGRYLFYSGSCYTSWGANPISDKVAKRPGTGAATFANVSSYTKGLNGIYVDIQDPTGGTAINATDFDFKYGNTTTPANWTSTPVPTSVTSTLLSGTTYRVKIVFPDRAAGGIPTRNWLKVTTKTGGHTGLPTADVFYFGLCVGETGANNTASAIYVGNNDYNACYTARTTFPTKVALTSVYDFTKDAQVTNTDYNLSYNERGDTITKKLVVITP